MKDVIKKLKLAQKELQLLSKKVDKLIAKVERLNKSKVKPVKKQVGKKKVSKPKTVIKKDDKATAIGNVHGFIKRSKKGVDTATLVTKTGYGTKKIQNIIFKLKKQGKVKSAKRGVYIKT